MASLNIKGKDYTVPAATLGQLRSGMAQKLKESDDIVGGKIDGKTWVDAVILRGEIIAEAMAAKYQDLTIDDVMTVLDMENTNTAWLGFLGASGLKMGEAAATGTGT